MKFTTGVLAVSSAINLSKVSKILNYIDKHPSKEGELAKKQFFRSMFITLLIIFVIFIPLCICTVLNITNTIDNPSYPDGATQQVMGHIARYEEKFWYTDSSQKYEFDLNEYTSDTRFEPGEMIEIYLDDNNHVISISHQNDHKEWLVNIILMFAIPIVLLLLHAVIGKNTYCKMWSLYAQWYQQEIEPYSFQDNFEELIADKKFYDIRVNMKELSAQERRIYNKEKIKAIVYSVLLILCVILTIYICNKLKINPNSWFVLLAIIVYVGIFYVLIDSSEVEMHRIKTGYYKEKSK